MRDGVNIARLGMPVIALVTEEFWPQGDFMAKSFGMPSVPRVKLPHPIAGSGEANMEAVAAQMVDEIVDRFAA